MSVVFMRDGVTFSFCPPTALPNSLGVSTARKKQGLTPSLPRARAQFPSTSTSAGSLSKG